MVALLLDLSLPNFDVALFRQCPAPVFLIFSNIVEDEDESLYLKV